MTSLFCAHCNSVLAYMLPHFCSMHHHACFMKNWCRFPNQLLARHSSFGQLVVGTHTFMQLQDAYQSCTTLVLQSHAIDNHCSLIGSWHSTSLLPQRYFPTFCACPQSVCTQNSSETCSHMRVWLAGSRTQHKGIPFQAMYYLWSPIQNTGT